MRASWWLVVLLAGCQIYKPEVLDCQIRCGVGGECPRGTSCANGGMCRPPGASGVCQCRPGEVQTCGGTTRVCVAGTRTCQETREWGACTGVVAPTTEVCNGVDDDCDGVIDGNPQDAARCPLRLGVCGDGFAERQCVGGRYLECDARSYGPDYEAEETRCDRLDNDCDGVTDFPPFTQQRGAVAGPLFLFTVRGKVLAVHSTGQDTQLAWYSPLLEPEGLQALGAEVPEVATADDDGVILGWRDDAGVVLRRQQYDGGGWERRLTGWLGANELDVSRGFAAATVAGGVELLALDADGGAPVRLGDDDGGGIRLSASGAHLSWPGGVWRTRDLHVVQDAGVGSLLAMFEMDGGALRAVSTRFDGYYFADLRTSAALTRLPLGFGSRLDPRSAIPFRGQLLVMGRTADGWPQLVTEQQVVSAFYVQHPAQLKLAATSSTLVGAFVVDGGLSLAGNCAP